MNNLPQVTKLWIYQETNSQRHVWALSLQKENFQNYISFLSSDSITCRRRFARITAFTWGAEGYEPRIKKEQLERPYFSAPFVHSGKIYHSPRIRFLKKNLSFGKRIVRSKMPKTRRRHFKKNWPKKKKPQRQLTNRPCSSYPQKPFFVLSFHFLIIQTNR